MKKELRAIEARYSQFNAALEEVLKRQRKFEQALLAYKAAIDTLATEVSETELLFDGYIKDDSNKLLDATKQMQETQMSFNLQYLQLQSQMQHENRSYTAISNIMKTKHDTVKNSISNVR
jgi:hypothetical protein